MIGNDWNEILEQELKKPYFQRIGEFLASEREASKIIFPNKEDYFRALKKCSFKETKVIMMGLEPYNRGESDGLSFSCHSEVIKTPYSLKKIFENIEEEIYDGFKVEQDISLDRWAEQGILLLNRYLSVERGKPESHSHIGWDIFTSALIKSLSAKDESLVFLLFGSKARQVKKDILNKDKHLIIECEHPAASAYKETYEWDNKECFKRTSAFLQSKGHNRIEW